jgi:hypothetical protein
MHVTEKFAIFLGFSPDEEPFFFAVFLYDTQFGTNEYMDGRFALASTDIRYKYVTYTH